MAIKKLTAIGAATLAIVLAGGTGGVVIEKALAQGKPAAADAAPDVKKEAPATDGSLNGMVVELSGSGLKVSVVEMKDDQKVKTDRDLIVGAGAEILFASETKGEKKPAKPEDVTPGTPVSVTLAEDGTTVQTLTIQGATVGGTVSAVVGMKLTITSKGKDGPEEKAYTLTDTTKIITGHGPKKGDVTEGKMSDVAVGTRVTLRLSASDKTAVRVVDVLPAAMGKGK